MVRAAAIASAILAIPASASASTPQPLRDVAPLGTHFKDRVFTSGSGSARAALSGEFKSYLTKEGTSVAAAISDRYGDQLRTDVVQSYVDFLDSLTHGPELATLRIYIAPPEEVLSECGGLEGTLACYDSRTQVMTVPGEEPDTGSSGVTTSYVVAHEYGHHIAASRSNEPFNPFAFGPKYWSSYELVCDRAQKRLLAPGDENKFYRQNPGEGWAETYAQLKYPGIEWMYDPIMKPDAGAFAAATRDVLDPWQGGVTKTYKGTFGKSGSNTRRFGLNLTLDGRFRLRLSGPRGSNYNVIAISGDRRSQTRNAGSRDTLAFDAVCREQQTERVSLVVKRVKGSGPFTMKVSYAG